VGIKNPREAFDMALGLQPAHFHKVVWVFFSSLEEAMVETGPVCLSLVPAAHALTYLNGSHLDLRGWRLTKVRLRDPMVVELF
jgi:hypothetical protein